MRGKPKGKTENKNKNHQRSSSFRCLSEKIKLNIYYRISLEFSSFLF